MSVQPELSALLRSILMNPPSVLVPASDIAPLTRTALLLGIDEHPV